ncbi:MAG TPA: dihydroorotate dehydrogenase electron transfer subunit [Candidatus Hydrogenedentes bacterium]|jgi:dihydroorotate dehydrogenase electron transfer subunit|nr:dihydroorotate dehydrogenase electron transfer subunit [Candidatus Hydrogenedentota bacterium]
MTVLLECEITAHQDIAPGHKRLALRAEPIATVAVPGQFCMLEAHEGLYPFLRRPMSIERIYKDGISILYKVLGLGTRLLAHLPVGAVINVQGPLGNGFPLPQGFNRHILVAGGIGVAPFPGLAEAILQKLGRTPEVVLAARNDRMLLLVKEFSRMGCPVHIATDDGSAGMQGFASDALESLTPDSSTLVYCCGPTAMMRAVHGVCARHDVRCYASLEAEMACGDGVCMGCVVETNSEDEARRMVRVCREGPVFDTRDINWNGGVRP